MPLFTPFYTSQVVQDFFHEQYHPLQSLTPRIETPGRQTLLTTPLMWPQNRWVWTPHDIPRILWTN